MSLSEEERRQIEKEVEAQKYRAQVERKMNRSKWIWTILSSSLVIFVFTMIGTQLIPYWIRTQEEERAEQVRKKAQTREDSLSAAKLAEEQRLKEKERAKNLSMLRTELLQRIKVFVQVGISISPTEARAIKQTYLGTSAIYSEWKGSTLSDLILQLNTLSDDTEEKAIAAQLQEYLIQQKDFLMNLSAYLKPVTNKGKVLPKGAEIKTKRGFNQDEMKTVITRYVVLESGEEVKLEEEEVISGQKVVGSTKQERAFRALVEVAQNCMEILQ